MMKVQRKLEFYLKTLGPGHKKIIFVNSGFVKASWG